MYDRVLVPLDGSERAETILPHVQDIAQHYKAKLFFISVLEQPHSIVAPDGIYIPSQEVIVQHQQEMEEYLETKAAAFREQGFDVETQVIFGRVVDSICKTAVEIDADLVAIASHGRSGLAQVFYGSVAAGVLHLIDRALLLVRAE